MSSQSCRVLACVLLVLAVPALAHAQIPPATAAPPSAQAAPPSQSDLDRDIVASESDFVIVALPSTLPLERGKFAFRMTHRFAYAINKGLPNDNDSLGQQFLKNFFGFDSIPAVGLEFRMGIAPGTQFAVHRINDRTLEMLGQQRLVKQKSRKGFSIDAIGAGEGRQNFTDDFGYALGAVVSHRITSHGTFYFEPIGVFNSNPDPLATSDNTFLIGLGARVRLGKSRVSLVAEGAPRAGGFGPGPAQVSFGIEDRIGGHVFQLNFSNGFSTSLRQLASARPPDGVQNWHIGFNLTRKF